LVYNIKRLLNYCWKNNMIFYYDVQLFLLFPILALSYFFQ